MIKKQKTSYMGEKCMMIILQDITAYHMVDKEIKDNEIITQINECFNREIQEPLNIITEKAKDLLISCANPRESQKD